MVEIVDEGLLVENPSYSQSIKTYDKNGSISYCEDLELGGYSDFRLPTYNELKMIFKISFHSSIEHSYFDNYYSDYKRTNIQDGHDAYKNIVYSSQTVIRSLQINYDLGYYTIKSGNGKSSILCVREW